MVGLFELLNPSTSPEENCPIDTPHERSLPLPETKLTGKPVKSETDPLDTKKSIFSTTAHRIYKAIPKCKIHKKIVSEKNLVDIAIRRKSVGRKITNLTMSSIHESLNEQDDSFFPNDFGSNSKLHIKSLEAGLRVKLTLSPSLLALYKSLIPHTNQTYTISTLDFDHTKQKSVANVLSDNPEYAQQVRRDLGDADQLDPHTKSKNQKLVSKPLQLIDNNLVNLSKTSNKVLQNFSLDKNTVQIPAEAKKKKNETMLPTFNSFSTAVQSLFSLNHYTIVRVTRSSATDSEGSSLLKIETAKPGDYTLFDDSDFLSEMIHSIGKEGSIPNNLFLKKIVARPRYKSDMKIYLIPQDCDISLYVNERMLERDLINGVVDFNAPQHKKIYCTFDCSRVVRDFSQLLQRSEEQTQLDRIARDEQLARTLSTELTSESDGSKSSVMSAPPFLHRESSTSTSSSLPSIPSGVSNSSLPMLSDSKSFSSDSDGSSLATPAGGSSGASSAASSGATPLGSSYGSLSTPGFATPSFDSKFKLPQPQLPESRKHSGFSLPPPKSIYPYANDKPRSDSYPFFNAPGK